MSSERRMSSKLGNTFADTFKDLGDELEARPAPESDEVLDSFLGVAKSESDTAAQERDEHGHDELSVVTDSEGSVAPTAADQPKPADSSAVPISQPGGGKPKQSKKRKKKQTSAAKQHREYGAPLSVGVSLPPAVHAATTAEWEQRRLSVPKLLVEALDQRGDVPVTFDDEQRWKQERSEAGGGSVPRVLRLQTGLRDQIDGLRGPGVSRSTVVGILLSDYLGSRPGDLL